MIELSLTELALFAWGALATGAALKYRGEYTMVRNMLQHFVENKEAREQLLKAHENFLKERRA